ncbi:MAG: ATP-dependent Clp protease adaptor ClpS [Opitutales bacterium]
MGTETTADPHASTATEAALPWNVVVLNDPVNLMSYVVMVFRKVFGYDRERATKHMLEVHELGRSIVWTGPREQAETFVHILQGWQLQARLEHSPA